LTAGITLEIAMLQLLDQARQHGVGSANGQLGVLGQRLHKVGGVPFSILESPGALAQDVRGLEPDDSPADGEHEHERGGRDRHASLESSGQS
jgi:hypothetical protein